jgi:hypothetical protein
MLASGVGLTAVTASTSPAHGGQHQGADERDRQAAGSAHRDATASPSPAVARIMFVTIDQAVIRSPAFAPLPGTWWTRLEGMLPWVP